ncbi:MAG TPA: serine/threonine protein kinase, partial [Myxococcaceae bacterium]|nr:serine/threonine protein kinase [Myxococcaceae bacterium]
MGCNHCFINHPAGEPCLLRVGPPVDGEAVPGMGEVSLALVHKLGEGALGSVYLAEHPSTGCQLAVKVLH